MFAKKGDTLKIHYKFIVRTKTYPVFIARLEVVGQVVKVMDGLALRRFEHLRVTEC